MKIRRKSLYQNTFEKEVSHLMNHSYQNQEQTIYQSTKNFELVENIYQTNTYIQVAFIRVTSGEQQHNEVCRGDDKRIPDKELATIRQSHKESSPEYKKNNRNRYHPDHHSSIPGSYQGNERR